MTKDDLITNAETKMEAATTLANAGKFDDAIYLCGYAVEFLLKAIVYKNQNYSTYPDNTKKYKARNLDNLINLAGIRFYFANQK